MNNNIESRLSAIENRNKRVELDKRWETSWTRRILIALLTYIVTFTYLLMINNSNPFVNAFVPALGFILSTLAVKNVREVWQKKHR